MEILLHNSLKNGMSFAYHKCVLHTEMPATLTFIFQCAYIIQMQLTISENTPN